MAPRRDSGLGIGSSFGAIHRSKGWETDNWAEPGPVVIVGVAEAEAAALFVGSRDGAVIVAGTDAAGVGTVVVRLRAAGIDAAGYVGDESHAEVLEMAAELFPGRVPTRFP